MEALAESSPKHQVALDLLARWKQELKTEKAKYKEPSEEFYSLKARAPALLTCDAVTWDDGLG